MEWRQIVVLAVVQGLAFDVALHFGSLFAVLLYFCHKLIAMARSWCRSLVSRQIDNVKWGRSGVAIT